VKQILVDDLKRWNMNSAVRSKVWAYDLDLNDTVISAQLQWFPEHMAPAFTRPEISNLSQTSRQRLLAKHLIYFLRYTTALELQIVNRAVGDIIENNSGINVPKKTRNAALRLYTDEAYHALFSEELADQLAQFYATNEQVSDFKRIEQITKLEHSENNDDRPLFRFLTAFVSETAIAKELFDLSSASLKHPVASMFQDHLQDEAQHCKFFSKLFIYGWKHADEHTRNHISRLLPILMKTFALIDEDWLSLVLRGEGISAAVASNIAQSLNSDKLLSQRAKRSCVATFGALRSAGAMINKNHSAPFHNAGLLDEL
jgi:hypothetical protein